MANQFNVFQSGDARAAWAAVFAAFILWLLGLLISPLFVDRSPKEIQEIPPVATNKSSWHTRTATYTRAARDSLIILTIPLIVNTAGYGITAGVIVLEWVSFAFLAFWSIFSLFAEWTRVEVFMLLVVLVLQIINFALAFRE